MSTLNTLAADVYTLTNRPDLVAETLISLRKAIRKFHGAETWKRDIATVRLDMTAEVPIQPDQYRWALDLITKFPGLRRFKNVNYPADLQYPQSQIPAPLVDWSVGMCKDKEFKEVSADNIFDSYGLERINYYMINGNVVTVRSGWYVNFLDFIYYKWPDIPTDPTATLTSWIVNDYPDGIIEEAAGAVFKMIGKDEEFARFQTLFQENLAIMKTSTVGEVQ